MDRVPAAMAALEDLAGFAASPVLEARLRRAANLLPDCEPAEAHIDHPAWAALLDVVTIQETRLFRHPAQSRLAGSLMPARLVAARTENRPLEMLSAGCATGEEAYTLAAQGMAATETSPGADIAVLGLDLCRPALAMAEAGAIIQGLGDPLGLVPIELRPWLSDADGHPRLHPVLRRRMAFRRANLLGGLDKQVFDVIFCRNVLIYLTDAARQRVLAGLIKALRPGGILGLGPSDRSPAGLLPQSEAVWVKPHG